MTAPLIQIEALSKRFQSGGGLFTKPRAMMAVRVHSASTSSRMCVEMMMALVGAISPISERTSCFWFGSRPSVGSSRMRTSGSCRIAWARPTRRLKPLDRVSIV